MYALIAMILINGTVIVREPLEVFQTKEKCMERAEVIWQSIPDGVAFATVGCAKLDVKYM